MRGFVLLSLRLSCRWEQFYVLMYSSLCMWHPNQATVQSFGSVEACSHPRQTETPFPTEDVLLSGAGNAAALQVWDGIKPHVSAM